MDNLEQKAMQLDNDLRQRQVAMQENTSEFGDWRMAKAFEDLLAKLSTAKDDTEFVSMLRKWVSDTNTALEDHIADRVKARAEINDIQEQILENDAKRAAGK